MPLLTKAVISRYFSSECERQLRLMLSPATKRYNHEREAANMPPEQPPRPGLEQITQAGDTWAEQKLAELEDVFGPNALLGRRAATLVGVTPRRVRFQADQLATWIGTARIGQFMVECEFPVGATFAAAMGVAGYAQQFNLEFGDLRPDLIEVRAPGSAGFGLTPTGEVATLAFGDPRLQLRVIDIKLTSEPGPSYFAEVTYYSLALAAWLVDQQLADRFVVTPDAAVWPGSHESSALINTYRTGGPATPETATTGFGHSVWSSLDARKHLLPARLASLHAQARPPPCPSGLTSAST